MRLTQEQIDTIRETTIEVFGNQSEVRLFGSRVDDVQRGGDIDLYINAPTHNAELVDAKLRLLVGQRKRLGNRKIDVVVRRSGAKADAPIDRIATQTGIRLLWNNPFISLLEQCKRDAARLQ